MAKTRLSKATKNALVRYVEDNCTPAKEHAVLIRTYKKALKAIIPLINKQYPPEEMKILKKYKIAGENSTIRIRFHNGHVTEFLFMGKDAMILPPFFKTMLVVGPGRTTALLGEYEEASIAFEDERRRRIRAYHELLRPAKYLEDITNIWPEAEKIVSGLKKPQLPAVVISSETKHVIRVDQKERAAS